MLLGHGLVRDEHGEEMHKSKGNSIPFEGAADDGYEIDGKDGKPAKHPPMGADLIRWLYCRHNPAANINFGPGPAEEVRSKFILKLWNTYAFFCNYARLDGFDPTTPRGAAEGSARHRSLDPVRLAAADRDGPRARSRRSTSWRFCLEAEEFVDDKLSNWYVRRNRRRFWKSEQGADKLAAYQTLYTVLVTLTKLFAPDDAVPDRDDVPQPGGPRRAESVHLLRLSRRWTRSLIDAQLSDGHGSAAPARLARLGGPQHGQDQGAAAARGAAACSPATTPIAGRSSASPIRSATS